MKEPFWFLGSIYTPLPTFVLATLLFSWLSCFYVMNIYELAKMPILNGSWEKLCLGLNLAFSTTDLLTGRINIIIKTISSFITVLIQPVKNVITVLEKSFQLKWHAIIAVLISWQCSFFQLAFSTYASGLFRRFPRLWCPINVWIIEIQNLFYLILWIDVPEEWKPILIKFYIPHNFWMDNLTNSS